MLHLLFTCDCKPFHSDMQIKKSQQLVWQRSMKYNIAGFFIRCDDIMVGMFEGPEKNVISQVEYLVRRRMFEKIRVLRETRIEQPEWQGWNTEIANVYQITSRQLPKFEGLAHVIRIAVDADRNGTQWHS